MKTQNLFEKIHCVGRDSKARRRSNVAPSKRAMITAQELERGVTLETLETIGVPVFRYATQITIHGSLPDFNPPVNGYKFLTQNKNGSIGVRFAGIDAAKKRTIYKAGRLSKLSASLTSQGLILSRTFHARDNHEQARADSVAFAQVLASEYAALVYGEIYGTVLPWGSGYAVSLFVGAVPEENVATICERLCGISNEADMDKEEERRATAWRAERAELIANCKKENAVLT